MALQTLVYTAQPVLEGYALLANEQAVKTPAGAGFVLPTKALADAVVAEWRAQSPTKFNPAAMPLTQLAATCLDLVMPDRDAALTQLMAQLDHDMLCHRADEPDALRQQQQLVWQPYLEWCLTRCDALLTVCSGLLPEPQSPAAQAALRHVLNHYDSWQLTGLSHAAALTHSLILGLALAESYKSANEIFAAAELESLQQMAKWGIDPLAKARHDSIKHELETCAEWFRLLASGG